MRNPYRSPNEIVGTTNMSMEAMASRVAFVMADRVPIQDGVTCSG
jgi:hypothetical protein